MVIYKVVNTINNKMYIGKTEHELSKRKSVHISLSKQKHPKQYFHRAIKKYGLNNFKWFIIEKCINKNELIVREKYYIKKYNTYENGYNLTLGGEGTSGVQLFGEKNGMYGKRHPNKGKKIHSDEFKEKMRNNNPACRPEVRAKISKSHEGRSYNYNTNQKKGADSLLSKTYIISFPNGEKKIIKGLRAFCKKHPELTRQCLTYCAQKKQNQHRGFGCEYYNNRSI